MTAERIDLRDGYATYPTPTGTLPVCVECGALVGDKAAHTEWHEDEAKRVADGLARLARMRGRLR